MKKKIISIILLILWMALIFYLSNQNGSSSTNTSNYLINDITSILRKITGITVSTKVVSCLVFPIRKMAHIFEYFILGILSLNLISLYEKLSKMKVMFIASLLCFLCASLDEFHQLFIIGRSGNFTDILIDSFGFLLGIFVFYEIIKKRRNNLLS